MTRALSSADLQKLSHLATALRDWSPEMDVESYSGRGIVIAAGGSAIFTNAFVLINVLRHTLNCRLPIEVWHFGSAEMSPAMAALLEQLDVSVVDAEPVIRRYGATVRDGWQLKPFAILRSRFAEVLLLDADQVPVLDPEVCFEWAEYREAGAVFWPDIVDLLEANPVWGALGLPARRARSMESGQVLVDKRRHLRALAITSRLNEEAKLLYEIIYGDKDTFLLGWELAGVPFAMVPHRPFRDDGMLVQRDFDGRPLFQHRTGAKWRYAGEQAKLAPFVHEEACLGAIERLRREWGGVVFHAPDRSVDARETEVELVMAGLLRLEIGDEERLELELLSYGEIGRGRAVDRRNWWCSEEQGHLVLNVVRNEGLTYRLERADEGLWVGQRLRPPVTPAALLLKGGAPMSSSTVPSLVDSLLRAAGFGGVHCDETRLAQAMSLLAAAEPGLLTRLRAIACEAPAVKSLELSQLLVHVERETASLYARHRVDSDPLRQGYSPANTLDDSN